MHGTDEFLCRHRVALKCEAVELVGHRSKQIIRVVTVTNFGIVLIVFQTTLSKKYESFPFRSYS